jgi:TP901 family phage tail tape measure protein
MARTVEILVEVDTKTGRANLKKLDKGFKDLDKTTKKGVSTLGDFKNALGALAISATVAKLKGLATEVAAADDRIGKISKRLGESAQFLSRYGFAAERSGVAIGQFTIGIQRANRRIAQFATEGTGEAAVAIERLGLNVRDSEGNLRSFEDLLPDLARGFENVGSQQERLALAFKLFDSEGTAMLQLLGQGVDGMEALARTADRLGATLSDDAVKNAAAFNDAMLDLKTSTFALVRESGLVEFFAESTKGLSQMIQEIRSGDYIGILERLGRAVLSITPGGAALANALGQGDSAPGGAPPPPLPTPGGGGGGARGRFDLTGFESGAFNTISRAGIDASGFDSSLMELQRTTDNTSAVMQQLGATVDEVNATMTNLITDIITGRSISLSDAGAQVGRSALRRGIGSFLKFAEKGAGVFLQAQTGGASGSSG